jgi:hypothetical protein
VGWRGQQEGAGRKAETLRTCQWSDRDRQTLSKAFLNLVTFYITQKTKCSLPSSRVPVLKSVWKSELCKFWPLQVLTFASFDLCKFWPLQVLTFASSDLCKFWPLQVLTFASSDLCKF